MPSVLAIGLDPSTVDLSKMPGLTPDLVRAYIDSELQRLRALGYEVESWLVDPREPAEAQLAARLEARQFDCVMIGAGLRDSSQLLLFEKLLNVIHARAPRARLCFNTSPADTAEAVRRWIDPAGRIRAVAPGEKRRDRL